MQRFLHIIKLCLKDKIFISGGRADRWEFFVFNIFAILLRVIIFLAQMALAGLAVSPMVNQGLSMLFVVINFILFISQYTSTIRRLHDTNRTGHHLLPILAGLVSILVGIFTANTMYITIGEIVAVVGMVYVIVLCALPGTKGDNRFGSPVSSN